MAVAGQQATDLAASKAVRGRRDPARNGNVGTGGTWHTGTNGRVIIADAVSLSRTSSQTSMTLSLSWRGSFRLYGPEFWLYGPEVVGIGKNHQSMRLSRWSQHPWNIDRKKLGVSHQFKDAQLKWSACYACFCVRCMLRAFELSKACPDDANTMMLTWSKGQFCAMMSLTMRLQRWPTNRRLIQRRSRDGK